MGSFLKQICEDFGKQNSRGIDASMVFRRKSEICRKESLS
jgi:hypothetical protein